MSQVLESDPLESSPPPTADPVAISGRSKRSLLVWCLGSCVLLLGSGVVRSVQSRIYQEEVDYKITSPFPLATIPKTIGDWKTVEGSEAILDPLTTRITGSTDHILRTYTDEMTGVSLSVMILYGPAEPVLPHTPQICYPSSGFQAFGNPDDRPVKIDDKLNTSFRASVFVKPGGRTIIRQAVYHSFRLDGLWSPSIGNQKFPRRSPGIFKVQIQRRMIDGERIDEDEPTESYLKSLIPILEQMIAQAASKPPAPGATHAAPTTAAVGR